MAGRTWLRRGLARTLLLLALLASLASDVNSQGVAEADAIDARMERLYTEGKYAEAAELAAKALALREAGLPPGHSGIALSVNNLAMLYRSLGRYAEAEPLMKRSLQMREQADGADHVNMATPLNNLATLYFDLARYVEAERLFARALAIREGNLPAGHPQITQSLNNLAFTHQALGRLSDAEALFRRALALNEASLPSGHGAIAGSTAALAHILQMQGRLSEAEPIFQRALALTEAALPAGHPEIGTVANGLGELYLSLGRMTEAEPLFRRALALREAALPAGHMDIAASLSNLGLFHANQGQPSEAEPLFKRALGLYEAALPAGHPAIGNALNNLAYLYQSQGRFAEAEPLYQRALAIDEAALPAGHPRIAAGLNNLAHLYIFRGRHADAEPLFTRALAMREAALPAGHPDIAQSLNNLAYLHQQLGRLAEAEPLYVRALAMREAALPAGHPDVAEGINNLASVHLLQKRFADAEPLFRRSLALREVALPADHHDIIVNLNNLAALHLAQAQWSAAAAYWRRSTSLIVQRSQRGTDNVGQVLTGKRRGENDYWGFQFGGLIKATYRLSTAAGRDTTLAAEAFKQAQWAKESDAAASLAKMASRGGKGGAKLEALVRERQDAVEEWQKRDAARVASASQAPEKRDRQAEAANVTRIAAIEARLVELDRRLATEFPDYADLARPTPLSVADVQAQLGRQEALVLLLDTDDRFAGAPDETFIWVVTKTDMRWVRSDIGSDGLAREVTALRCGLDATSWDDDAAAQRCKELLKAEPSRVQVGDIPANTLPFDRARAHALYAALFGQVEDLIRGKHLLVVPSGPLTQLPFQVLVTAAPASGDYRSTAWLARKHAVTVLPAVSSLRSLRRVAKPSTARKPMLGIGNPLLDGDPAERPWEAQLAKQARDKQTCPKGPTPLQRLVGQVEKRRSVQKVATRSGRADLDHLRTQAPLHDTADELCAVARDLRLSPDDILLGAKATEANVKQLNLAQYRVLHFATHGTIAGEIEGTAEPGLILTPPKEQSDNDDGYLSASEVAALKLDADWVILSACNTAAGGAQGAEALSGLARAFFYAGARALLVSHWAVYSDSTVKLVTKALGAMAADKAVGRSEALRRSMLAVIDKEAAHEAHPAYWAPFVVVGEGGR